MFLPPSSWRRAALSIVLTFITFAGALRKQSHADVIFGVSAEQAAAAGSLHFFSRDASKLKEALQAFKEGSHQRCSELLHELRKQDPSLPPAETMLVWFLMSDGKLDEAKRTLEAVAARYPYHPHTTLTQGQIALSENRFADAAVLLEKSVTVVMPEDWEQDDREQFAAQALDTLATAYQRQNRWTQVLQTLQAAENLATSPVRVRRIAFAHYNLGDTPTAQDLLAGLHQESKLDLSPALYLAQFAFQSGRFDEVNEHLTKALTDSPSDIDARLWAAEWALIEGENERASELIEAAEKRYSQRDSDTKSESSKPSTASTDFHSEICRLRGLLQSSKGNFEAAIALLDEALEAKSNPNQQRHLGCQKLILEVASCPTVQIAHDVLPRVEQNAVEHSSHGLSVSLLGWVYTRLDRRQEAATMLAQGVKLSAQLSPDQAFWMADHMLRSNDETLRPKAIAMLQELANVRGQWFLTRNLAETTLKELQ